MTGLPRPSMSLRLARLARLVRARSLPFAHALAPSARDRRAVLLGAAVLLPALAWSMVWRPYVAALADARARVAAERELLSRERALVADARGHAGAIASLRAPLHEALGRLLESEGDPAATAALATYVGEAVEVDHVLVTQVDPSAPDTTTARGLTRTVLDVTGETDLTGLLTLLRELELGDWMVPVEQLHVESRLGAGPMGTTHGSLLFRLRIVGFRPQRPLGDADVRIARAEASRP